MTAVLDCTDIAHGTLLTVNPLPEKFWPEGTRRGFRIEYVAPVFTGGKRAVSGSVFLPDSTASSAPVLSWAHCTVGINEHNAPSKVGLCSAERRHLRHWLAAGYIVTATDYEGLGTSEPHPYLDGEAIADDIIDIVLAVHDMDVAADNRTVIAGFSQGGHGALYAAALCTAYAPELDLLGTVSLAPPVRFLDFVRDHTADGAMPVNALIPAILAGLQVRRPAFTPDEPLEKQGRALLRTARHESMKELLTRCAALTNDEAGFTGIAAWQPLVEALESTSPPATKYDRPLFLCAGGADPVFPVEHGRDFTRALADCGTNVFFHEFDALDHMALVEPAAPEATRWATDLITAVSRETACRETRFDAHELRFRVLDATGNGRIGLDDFRVHAMRLTQSFGRPLGDPCAVRLRENYERLARELVRHYDLDGDGSIDLHEFVRPATRIPDAVSDSASRLVSSVMQLLGDNSRGISRSQFRSVTRGLGIDEPETDALFTATDTDGNGIIDAAELTAGVLDFLTGDDPRSPGYWLFGRLKQPAATQFSDKRL
ncbi:alpha/beta fold hydrolase [Nocardia sp. 2]|uniref:Alpha/beta fold hydrolase n=1 Tax=Nocardia acididurans TaxID=2802282 RepID=A0ABS1MFG7_9NOCA|nr:lipase family protein [Nocardia acididurans]MBL1079383.1 alpha/beta fold hydrolase [Nocardia acididurans]